MRIRLQFMLLAILTNGLMLSAQTTRPTTQLATGIMEVEVDKWAVIVASFKELSPGEYQSLPAQIRRATIFPTTVVTFIIWNRDNFPKEMPYIALAADPRTIYEATIQGPDDKQQYSTSHRLNPNDPRRFTFFFSGATKPLGMIVASPPVEQREMGVIKFIGPTTRP